jgi:hypothetical protein
MGNFEQILWALVMLCYRLKLSFKYMGAKILYKKINYFTISQIFAFLQKDAKV